MAFKIILAAYVTLPEKEQLYIVHAVFLKRPNVKLTLVFKILIPLIW